MTQANEQTKLSDDEINAIIQNERNFARKGTLCLVLSAVFMVLFVYMYFAADRLSENPTMIEIIVILVSIIFLSAGFYIRGKARDNAKNKAGLQLINLALNAVFDNVDYQPESRLSDTFISEAKMPFSFRYDKINGSDYVRASYKDVNIEMSDICLIDIEVEYHKDRGRTETERTVFEGLWMVCDFHKKLSSELRLAERSKLGQKFALGGVKTDSEAFNKQFYISSESEHNVFYILTPHMMEYIQAMDEKACGDTYMCFLQEGKVHIAINSGRNAFEIKSLNTDATELRERFHNEVSYVIGLIDELRLVDTFFEEDIKE